MDSTDALSHSRCRERRLNNATIKKNIAPVIYVERATAATQTNRLLSSVDIFQTGDGMLIVDDHLRLFTCAVPHAFFDMTTGRTMDRQTTYGSRQPTDT